MYLCLPCLPSESPRLLSPPHLSCGCLQVPCVSGALDEVSDGMGFTPCLYLPTPWRPSGHAAAASLADSSDEVLIPTPVLLCYKEPEGTNHNRLSHFWLRSAGAV
jgi:hypothetical protein